MVALLEAMVVPLVAMVALLVAMADPLEAMVDPLEAMVDLLVVMEVVNHNLTDRLKYILIHLAVYLKGAVVHAVPSYGGHGGSSGGYGGGHQQAGYGGGKNNQRKTKYFVSINICLCIYYFYVRRLLSWAVIILFLSFSVESYRALY